MPVNPYYRPYLTMEELGALNAHLVSIVQDTGIADPNLMSAFKKLARLHLSAGVGLTQPAHITKPSLLDKLELDQPLPRPDTPEKKRIKAYHKWINTPQFCTTEEVELAMTYRYEAKLMSNEEMNEFENKLMNGA